MSLTVTQRPYITYGGESARWNAVRNPVIYKMVRRDYTYDQANDNGGFMQLQFNGVNIVSSFVIGNLVYTTTRGAGTVTASIFSAGNTLVTLNIGYASASSGYVNNLSKRPLYAIEVEVYDDNDVILNDAPFRYVSDSTGSLLIDISSILKANLTSSFSGDLTDVIAGFTDSDVYKEFYIKYREVWTGSAESQTDDSSYHFFGVLGALQVPSLTGGNLAIYTVAETKFLTKFDKLVLWRGYNMLLSAIISENIVNDIFVLTHSGSSTPDDNSGRLMTFDLRQIIIDTSLNEGAVAIIESGPETPLSESLPLELRDACDNSIMLMARNSFGGVLQWLFDENQEYTFDYGNGIKAKRMRLFADDLTINQWEALQDFFTLGEVYRNNIREFTSDTIKTATRTDNQVYVVDSIGNKIGVIVIPRQPSTETKQVKHTFEIEIEYPEIFA